MMPPKCYTWLESCGSQLSDGKNEKLFFCILQSVGFSRTLRTDIFLYTEKLSYQCPVTGMGWRAGGLPPPLEHESNPRLQPSALILGIRLNLTNVIIYFILFKMLLGKVAKKNIHF